MKHQRSKTHPSSPFMNAWLVKLRRAGADSCEGPRRPRLAPSGADIPPQRRSVSFICKASGGNHVVLVGEQILKRRNVCKENSSGDWKRSLRARRRPNHRDAWLARTWACVPKCATSLTSVTVGGFSKCWWHSCRFRVWSEQKGLSEKWSLFDLYRFETSQANKEIKAKCVRQKIGEKIWFCFDRFFSQSGP